MGAPRRTPPSEVHVRDHVGLADDLALPAKSSSSRARVTSRRKSASKRASREECVHNAEGRRARSGAAVAQGHSPPWIRKQCGQAVF